MKLAEKMCESNMDTALLPLTPSPPATPETSSSSTRYTPELVKRMRADTCFRCRQQGHWSWDCPLNSPITTDSSHCTKIHCRCGHGFCEVKTSRSYKNSGRKYYVCPIKRGSRCKDFVKWCDDPIDESYLHPPPFKYPECECGAGVCRKVKEINNPDVVRYYFTCPIGEDHGSCGYRVWEDELLDNESIVPVRQSIQRTLHDFWEGCQTDKTNNDLSKEGDLLVEQSKRMRIMDNSENPSLMAGSELPEREDAARKAAPLTRREHDETTAWSAPSKRVGFPEFEFADDLQDLDIANSVPWDAIEEEGRLLSRLSTPSRIRCRQSVFQRHLFAGAGAGDDASFDPCPMGWLGRLLFFHPTQSLKFPPPQLFLCCIFPSFNAIVVPKQSSILSTGPGSECNQLAISNISQHVQLSTGCHTEVSRDVISPNKSPGNERKPMSREQRQRQIVLFAQQQLLIDLETLDPLEHESMREAAEATFGVLDSLAVNYKQFSEHVWDFINSASSLAEIQKSMENFLSPEEYNQRYEEEKVRLANIRDNHVKTKALLESSNQCSQSLREEASRLEAKLHEIQNQLTSCELETLKMESHLSEINRSMLEADTALKVRAEQAEIARKHNEERQAKQIVAKTALEKAKLELEN